jgi:hypothetical protein
LVEAGRGVLGRAYFHRCGVRGDAERVVVMVDVDWQYFVNTVY